MRLPVPALLPIVLILLVDQCLTQQESTARILLYTATADFRHDSIPTAIEALKNASSSYDVQFDATEDETLYTDENLALYDAIMWVSTTGEGVCSLFFTDQKIE